MRNVYSILRIGLVLLYGVSIFYSCSALKDNYKALQKCKFQVLSLETLKAELISFPPVPKIVFLAKVEITNPNETEVTLHKFDLSFFVLDDAEKESVLARVQSEEKIAVPALQKKTVDLQVETLFEKKMDRNLLQIALGILQAGLSGKELNFSIRGNFEYETIFGSVQIPVNEKIPLKTRKSDLGI
ncbi:LEA type 2 family protein [Leptospira santarosai]|uniref:NDR1/HIN1-like protein n=1 Tax=Leptospira santarosai TaxID=28183 RepID=UPI0002BC1FFB|nr:LEA type 2 family protein [Leptospira santarosai]EMF92546.1 late embryogenesis abundant protein [Leptospira santarosai str. ST188]EMO72962.1 late embryogenesis abundant protein [Leptospira santarosai str. 200403458]EMO98353.1 late embryogenesis abundant protein [Leptospira santarosai str. 200702252]MDI7217386.1 LEA type 2 family protein [Leptospira santarosai]